MLKEASLNMLSAVKIPEKITCASTTGRCIFGGFLGTVYSWDAQKSVRLFQLEDPISFIEEGASCMHIGTWSGEVCTKRGELLSKKKISEYPCKYIFSSSHYAIAATTNTLYLLDASLEKTVSSYYLGTYPLVIQESIGLEIEDGSAQELQCQRAQEIVVVTGYTITWFLVSERDMMLKESLDIHQHTGNTETLTSICAFSADSLFAGTIGGWIVSIKNLDVPGSCRVEKEIRVSKEKICSLILHSYAGKEYFICISPNTLYIINRKNKEIIFSGNVVADNSLFSLFINPEEPLCLVVSSVNQTIYRIDLSSYISAQLDTLSSSYELGSSALTRTPQDIYDELLQEINLGKL
ncbi:hypothetical protein NEFER03_1132 [Nematocida sp. LUAm3]|nr:hypothetical protein NEFER03_1132 [Nematocida sp. LUAm3]KAI5176332.1 hypothetical protein NEFER02_2120 [Nematocida sp. LUAm2]KAI5178237.1 hypothetical protein NEFER01_1404 [Nematocida sp. LUAm1]